MRKHPVKKIIVFKVALMAILLVGVFLIPWRFVNWGKLEILPASTITVSGEASLEEMSQIASFTAGVTAINDDKETAVDEVNQVIGDVISAVKSFGIAEEDIQTRSLSVHQIQEPFIEDEARRVELGQWSANNTIEVTLRDVDKASALADLLNESGATSVQGPNFSLDDTQESEVVLLEEAINNAREKAEKIAESSGRKLGKIVTVSEGQQTSGIFKGLEMDTGIAPIEPGTETVYKTVTVTFELR
ncbi:SIMPL domain-containing protein [Patescibacteria group bacterium]|nr:SIMPL domain-containing protein [Patescibacteria group bacterium]MBU0777124.1 SIMPL domain-containing protein [Patescibacteria group bacterium]MBU0845818.1 SIMPL domain-containing protein [Patescibacteria group bacterium]MBU0922845.1 SIMPL domain-containing protein [Patescibacteria group bacterium]MBU1066422.1 SIMPL domain-containing protein [Patescibacteria group bacterium]